jgi:hypothetical protein
MDSLSHYIKDHLTISQVSKEFNIGYLDANSRNDCPFCQGSRCLKTTRDQYFNCFKCGAHGSVFDLLLASKVAQTFSEALSMLRPLVDKDYRHEQQTTGVLDRLWDILCEERDSVAGWGESSVKTWLSERGVRDVNQRLIEDFACWSPQTTTNVKKLSKQDLQQLEEYKLLPAERFEGRILTPVRNLSGKIVHFTGRALDKEREPRWLHTVGQPAINNYLYQLNTVSKQNQDYVILCEGVTDCMSLRALGEPALACFGVNMPLVQHAWALKKKITHIVVVLDRDKYALGTPRAGQYKSWSGMMPHLVDLAVDLRVPIFCCMVPNWSGVKDVNDFLKEIDFDLGEFKRHIANHSVTLQQLALDMYLNTEEHHSTLWRLLKALPSDVELTKLKTYVEAIYPNWTDYVLARS